ncbi:MAG: 3-oxo-tetronate kinase, partial [Rhodospirillales bacterium]
MLLGCIADDFTGASDLGLVLAAQGLRVVQTVGVPAAGCVAAIDADAVIVALKSRTAPVREAVSESLAALSWLEARGARRFLFKYCSTFDSTDQGNIGPVADAVLDALDADFTIVCPAYPSLGRTVKEGDFYVGDVLLSESGMRDHPLTPMTDSNLVRVLGRQTAHKVDLIRYPVVAASAGALRAALSEARDRGTRYAIIDVLHDDDLRVIAEATADLTLITGGSGMALGLP